ncbi:MAG: tRNA (guanosine(37)-N1)-methyltransferase TrmD, partial [Lachnospiraceae bacterium]|nr:tRNA (guanosine(37)-N1)-methyltransferase TrmD [Lachnospiraceae bacterium]
IDERVTDEIVTDPLSIGDYVLTGGELPALVVMDAVSRLIPGVLGNDVSSESESFNGGLLEYPQYTRPPKWHDREVPQILLSGDHKKVEQYRMRAARQRTREQRPDLYAEYIKKRGIF